MTTRLRERKGRREEKGGWRGGEVVFIFRPDGAFPLWDERVPLAIAIHGVMGCWILEGSGRSGLCSTRWGFLRESMR